MTGPELKNTICRIASEDEKRPAIVDGEGVHTYGELADFLRHYAFDGEIDIITGKREFKTIARLIGAYCSGMPYVCIEEDIPKNREEAILKSLSGSVPRDVAYVTYTSGSTGLPKGIAIRKKSLSLFVDAFIKDLGLPEGIVVGGVSPLDFDISVKDIYVSLSLGGTYVLIERKSFFDPSLMYKTFHDNKVDTLFWTASSLSLMARLDVLGMGDHYIKRVVSSAEVMSADTFNYLKGHGIEIINAYGPTETTCNCTFYRAKEGDVPPLPIGESLSCCQVEVAGEHLCVRGETLLGYYVGSKGFVPYTKDYYDTGDLVEIKDGRLYYKGRADDMVKYRGHRLLLSGVTNLALRINGVSGAVTYIEENVLKLCYEGKATVQEVEEYLRSYLPAYSIPRIIKGKMTLNSHNKIKR